MTDYKALTQQLGGLIHGVPHKTANLANASALLFQTLADINWAGFYLMEDGLLVLGPFQGRTACIEIRPGRGVCGTAAAQDQTLALEYDIFSEIAENLIAARMEEGLTQGELAKRCGISQANISKFETGSSHPSLATLKRIADGLGRRLSVTFEDVSFEGEE